MNLQSRWKSAGARLALPALVLGIVATSDASAHVCNKPFAVLPAADYVCEGQTYAGPTVSRDGTLTYRQTFKKDGWIKGTNPQLGDSHEIGGGDGNFFVFHLDHRSRVTITFAADQSIGGAGCPSGWGRPDIAQDSLKPAFTLYRGLLPGDGHDDAAFDPLNPVDDVDFAPSVSPVDAVPGDPGIPAFLMDPATGTFSPNPAFTGDVADWYSDHYRPHRGYRDTLNFTLTGGMDATGNPVHLYSGQFDALGDWSMANEDALPGDELSPDGNSLVNGNWSKIFYITHAKSSGADRRGQYRPAAVTNLELPAGDYTIAADGANCNDDSVACVGPFLNGALSFRAVRVRR